jgi:hypothetical protein
MVESFEEFLHIHKRFPLYFQDGEPDLNEEKATILVKDLGEWAFSKAYGKKWELLDDRFYVYREIALACLGKTEIEKRLKALKGKGKEKVKLE